MYSIVEQTYIDGRRYFDIESDLENREEIKTETSRLLKKLMTKN